MSDLDVLKYLAIPDLDNSMYKFGSWMDMIETQIKGIGLGKYIDTDHPLLYDKSTEKIDTILKYKIISALPSSLQPVYQILNYTRDVVLKLKSTYRQASIDENLIRGHFLARLHPKQPSEIYSYVHYMLTEIWKLHRPSFGMTDEMFSKHWLVLVIGAVQAVDDEQAIVADLRQLTTLEQLQRVIVSKYRGKQRDKFLPNSLVVNNSYSLHSNNNNSVIVCRACGQAGHSAQSSVCPKMASVFGDGHLPGCRACGSTDHDAQSLKCAAMNHLFLTTGSIAEAPLTMTTNLDRDKKIMMNKRYSLPPTPPPSQPQYTTTNAKHNSTILISVAMNKHQAPPSRSTLCFTGAGDHYDLTENSDSITVAYWSGKRSKNMSLKNSIYAPRLKMTIINLDNVTAEGYNIRIS